MTNEVKDIIGTDCPWLQDRTILLTMTGSHAYGTNVETSDKDYKGVCIPPERYFFGLKRFDHYDTTGDNGVFKNEKLDISIVHINNLVKSAMAGTPNNIEILFTNPEHILYKDVFGFADELLSHRHDFLSKVCKNRMIGYAYSQKHKMLNKKGPNSRQDLIEKYGYDTKFFMHSVRLLEGCKQIFTEGTYSTYRPEREELLRCRSGFYTYEQAVVIIEDLMKEVDELYETSTAVPDRPDHNKINSWLIDLNKRALGIIESSGNTKFHVLKPSMNYDIQVDAAKKLVTMLLGG